MSTLKTILNTITGNVEQPPRVCKKCNAEIPYADYLENHCICPECGAYFRMRAVERLDATVDKGTFQEIDKKLKSKFVHFKHTKQHAFSILRPRITIRSVIVVFQSHVGVIVSSRPDNHIELVRNAPRGTTHQNEIQPFYICRAKRLHAKRLQKLRINLNAIQSLAKIT